MQGQKFPPSHIEVLSIHKLKRCKNSGLIVSAFSHRSFINSIEQAKAEASYAVKFPPSHIEVLSIRILTS